MARTSAVQLGMDCTIRSPRLPLRFPKRGSVLTVRAIHSVAERSSGCIAALFCCTDRVGEELGLAVGPVATLTTSVAAARAATCKAESDDRRAPERRNPPAVLSR